MPRLELVMIMTHGQRTEDCRYLPVLLPVLGLHPGLSGGSPSQLPRRSRAGGPDVVKLRWTALRPATKSLPGHGTSSVGRGVLRSGRWLESTEKMQQLPSQWRGRWGDLPVGWPGAWEARTPGCPWCRSRGRWCTRTLHLWGRQACRWVGLQFQRSALDSESVSDMITLVRIWWVTFSQGHGGHLSINGVENSLVTNLRFWDQADLGSQVGNSSTTTRHLCLLRHVKWRDIQSENWNKKLGLLRNR